MVRAWNAMKCAESHRTIQWMACEGSVKVHSLSYIMYGSRQSDILCTDIGAKTKECCVIGRSQCDFSIGLSVRSIVTCPQIRSLFSQTWKVCHFGSCQALFFRPRSLTSQIAILATSESGISRLYIVFPRESHCQWQCAIDRNPAEIRTMDSFCWSINQSAISEEAAWRVQREIFRLRKEEGHQGNWR
jgi:hypothetical protein